MQFTNDMVMKIMKKINFVVLPFAIWSMMVIFVLINNLIGNFTENMDPFPVGLSIFVLMVNFVIQLSIICVSTILSVKKFDMCLKKLVLSLPIMYLFFGLFSPPSVYLFVYTDKWSFFFTKYPAMPSWKASFFITLQFGVVMLATTLAATRRKSVD